MQKLNEVPSPVNYRTNEEIGSGISSIMSKNETLRGRPSIFYDKDRLRDPVFVPSCEKISPRGYLLYVPEQTPNDNTNEKKQSKNQEFDGNKSIEHLLKNKKPENNDNAYRRFDSVDLKVIGGLGIQPTPAKITSISGKGYKIEVTDLSVDHNASIRRDGARSKSMIEGNNFLESTPNNENNNLTLLSPEQRSSSPRHQLLPNSVVNIPSFTFGAISKVMKTAGDISEDGGTQDRSHNNNKDSAQRLLSERVDDVPDILPITKASPPESVTKEKRFQSQVQNKFRINLLDMVAGKSSRKGLEQPPTSDSNSNGRTGKKEEEAGASFNRKDVRSYSLKAKKTKVDEDLVQVNNFVEQSNTKSSGSKLVPRLPDLEKIDFLNGPDVVSPIYKSFNKSPEFSVPMDTNMNSSLLKPATTFDYLATERTFNGDDFNFDEERSPFGDEMKDGELSPSNQNKHVTIKKSMFGINKAPLRSKSVNLDSAENTKQQDNQLSPTDNEHHPNFDRSFLCPFDYTQRSNEIQEAAQGNNFSLDMKRKYYRNRSQVLETNFLNKSVDNIGQKKVNQYIVKKLIGRGTFGKVKIVVNSDTQAQSAMKIINKVKLKRKVFAKDKNAYTQIQLEVAVMKKMNHPNIVNLFEVIDDPVADKLYLLMELVEKGAILSEHYCQKEKGTLIEKEVELQTGTAELKILNEEKARRYFRHLVLGIDYMHNYANVIHRDIKPENLLINKEDVLKISDFNVAHMMEDTNDLIKTKGGTKIFLAPETWTNNSFRGKPLDIWAMGATLYYFLYGVAPFLSTNHNQLKKMILEDEPEFPDYVSVNQKAINLIKKCLIKDAEKRISIEQMMQDPWLTKDNKEPLNNHQSELLQVTPEDLSKALTVKLKTTILVAAGLKKSLNSARKTLNSINDTSFIIDKHEEEAV